jgi:hypothetical protein
MFWDKDKKNEVIQKHYLNPNQMKPNCPHLMYERHKDIWPKRIVQMFLQII